VLVYLGPCNLAMRARSELRVCFIWLIAHAVSHLCGFCCLLLVATSATWLNEVDVREIHDMVACRCDRQTVLVAQSNIA
jgi:hypothetical protein